MPILVIFSISDFCQSIDTMLLQTSDAGLTGSDGEWSVAKHRDSHPAEAGCVYEMLQLGLLPRRLRLLIIFVLAPLKCSEHDSAFSTSPQSLD
jgi:hypothetical protein